MTMSAFASFRGLMLTGAGVLATGAGVWGWSAHQRSTANASTLPAELSVQSIKQRMTDPEQNPWQLGEAFRRDDLTEEQRAELGRNMRQAFDELLTERVDEYFSAPPERQDAVLDGHIDDFLARMAAWERRRNERQRSRDREGDGSTANEEQPARTWFAQRSQEERKARSESRNPDQMARRMAYFTAMQQRMSQRGIQMPSGPGGRGGGARLGVRGPAVRRP